MGKSFNDDIFNNSFNLDSINGLNISKEAIEENQEKKESHKVQDVPNIDIDLADKIKEEQESKKIEAKLKNILQPTKQTVEEQTKEQQEKVQNTQELQDLLEQQEEEARRLSHEEAVKDVYTKKTMIFKQDYLDIIDGLATLNNMQIKDVLNQLLEKSINELNPTTREKALKTGRKAKPVKANKNIF